MPELPASEEAFKTMLKEGMTSEEIVHAVVSAFAGCLADLMAAIPKRDIDVDLQWQIIHLSVTVDNIMGAVAASRPPAGFIEVTGEVRDALDQLLRPLVEAIAVAHAEEPPQEGGEGNGHGTRRT